MKNSNKDENISLRLLALGLLLLLLNCIFELGVLPKYGGGTIPNPLIWIFTIFSKIISAVGIALIIGFTTDLVKELTNKKKMRSENATKLLINEINSLQNSFNLYQKNREYMTFVEYLFDNEYHNFSLLPRIRMYIQHHNIINKIHIKEMKITCIINNDENQNMGGSTAKVIFEYEISRDTLIDS